MPSSGASPAPRLSTEDSYLELLADTLESLDLPARGQFLQRYFRTISRLDLRESQCLQLWEEMLQRRREMSERLGRPVSLKTSLMDVLSSGNLLHVPVVLEYDELKRLQLNAVTDPLTGLYNRRLFSESLEKELTRARRYGQQLSLVILDLHCFKEVNDKHGHPRGDEVLRAAAETLKKSLRTYDSAFRIGGDEFALILPQTDAAQGLALSRRVESVFADALQQLQLSVAVSMDHGVATYPHDGEQTESLVRIADERLYRLKHTNHNRGAGAAAIADRPETREPLRTAAPAEKTPAAPRPTPIEFKKPAEPAEPAVAAPMATADASAQTMPPVPPYAQQRKAERVSMAGTNAYALIGEGDQRRARVLDLGFGGVALEFESEEELPTSTLAVLHVPILPPVRVNLRTVWSHHTSEGSTRVGCCFVS